MRIYALLAVSILFTVQLTLASDHDDGEISIKGRNVNLTDLYVFNEASHAGSKGSSDHLVLIMNTNPRSLPRQHYFFGVKARYDFHLSRILNKSTRPTGKEDIRMSFQFGSPRKDGTQEMTMTLLKDGKTWTKGGMTTSAIAPSELSGLPDATTTNQVVMDGHKVSVFAGLREDPFFFDVERFFMVRSEIARTGRLALKFLPPDEARDFTKNYNVNSIVVRVPIALLQSEAKEDTFDVWESISFKSGRKFKQIERLARPAVNEGLLLNNGSLMANNLITPSIVSQVISGKRSKLVEKVLTQASGVLDLLDTLDGKQDFLNGFNSQVVTGFLPDVMRIDSSKVFGKEQTAYNGDVDIIEGTSAAILTGGRKIKDDVIDITLSYLIAGDPSGDAVKDNVSYEGAPGNPNQGHRPLTDEFPYLARPY